MHDVVCCMYMHASETQTCIALYLSGQRAIVPARVLLYSWRSVRFGMAVGCAHVDGMLPATSPGSVWHRTQHSCQPLEQLSTGCNSL